ncbi:hypothetical protein [Actibacterium sp. 188UL27-1]|uniref:hypothetical protein n=1 Tax=Actibacterium sp. 188UL27-1 TaxID=2786961 RepID=UPI00195D544E|nr:hypothetical protein [Actibacterium sp. 188UL27-1]MBM7068078.1 hypothetical protein [Actibacterium sp. 188UL27-1]
MTFRYRPSRAYLFNRYCRIVFSLIVATAATVILTGLIWGDPSDHYTTRIGSFWVVPFVLSPALFLLGVVFLLLDRTVFPWIVRRPILFLLVAAILFYLSTVAYADSLSRFIFLCLLIYWLLTGRVAGRPGGSIAHFRQNALDEKIYMLFSALICAAFIYTVGPPWIASYFPDRHSNAKTEAFLENPVDWYGWWALVRFPDAQSCLEPGDETETAADLKRLDWSRIRNTADAELCIFRLLSASGGIEQATEWLEAQGFQGFDGWNSMKPHVNLDGTLQVDGAYYNRKQGPKFPADVVRQVVLYGGVLSTRIEANYDAEGEAIRKVRVSLSTK